MTVGIIASEVVNFGGSLLIEPATSAGAVQAQKDQSQKGLALWGESNLLPQEIIDLVSRSTELGPLLSWKTKMLHGKRLKAVIRNADGSSKEVEDDEIKRFLKARTTKRYWRESCVDINWFANVFVELIKANDKSTIAYIGTQDASLCRFAEMSSGKIKKAYVHADWSKGKIEDSETLKYELIDPYDYNAVKNIKESSQKKFLYPVSLPSPGKLYYQLSDWDGLRLSKWLELLYQIPVLKEAYINHVLNVVFKIGVNQELWPKWFKNWEDLTDEDKLNKKQEWLKAMNKKLVGAEKGGSSILTDFAYDDAGNLVEGVKIDAVPNPFKDGQWLEDSAEGSGHIMRALGVDATLVGAGPGKNMGAGSGSDKLVAVKIYEAMQVLTREVLLEPLYFVAEVNGWADKYPDLEFEVEGIELNFDKSTVRPIGQKGGDNAVIN